MLVFRRAGFIPGQQVKHVMWLLGNKPKFSARITNTLIAKFSPHPHKLLNLSATRYHILHIDFRLRRHKRVYELNRGKTKG